MSPLPVLSTTSVHPHRAVVLVDMPWTRDKDPRVPLGHASLRSSLRAAGVPTAAVVEPINAAGFSVERVLEGVLRAARTTERGVVVAIGAYVWCEPALAALLPQVRASLPEARIVLGGPQISFADDLSGLYPDADCLVRGAGEEALVALASAPERTPIPGVQWRGTPDQRSQARVDLTRLPSPFLDGTVPVTRGGFLRWETKRGCPFKCSFCQHRNPDSRDYQRIASARIREEIELFAQAGVSDIAVLDPIFNDGRRSLATLEHCRRSKLAARLSLQARLEMTDPTFLDATRGLNVRLEFGLQTIHKAEYLAVQRPNNMARVERNLAHVRASGHAFELSLIYGLPNQTLLSFEASVGWALDQGVPSIKAFPLMLLRGTELERERARWDLVENDEPIPQVIASNTFGPEEHARMSALSEALRLTEGAHPSLPELRRLADRLLPRRGRFSPAAA